MIGMRKTRATALLLALVLLLSTVFSGCGAHGKTLMKAGGEKISLNLFSLYLARMKASLGLAGFDIESDAFWNSYVSTDNVTAADYYTDQVFEGLKQVAAAMILYKESGLSLEKSVIQEIDDEIDAMIEEIGEGSKAKLNSVLAAYGANITTWRDASIIEAKLEQLKEFLYGKDGNLISATAKEEYYQATYYRGFQMQLANYYYVVDEDDDGRVIYYTDETFAHIAYDTAGEGVTVSGKDANGDDRYVTAEGQTAYDAANGVPCYHTDANGDYVTASYTDEEMQTRLTLAEQIAAECRGDPGKFLGYIEEYSDNSEFNQQYAPNGLYFAVGTYTGDSIFATFSAELAKLAVGDLVVLSTSSGYYVLMRAELDGGAWQNEANSRWFSTLTGMTLEYMLQKRLEPYLEKVTIKEKAKDGVSITAVEPDYYY